MIEIDEQSMPFVRTGQALLLLDLQRDFIETSSELSVKNPPGFVENTIKLVPEFRASGHIIWIRSIFETSRPFNEPQGESESVITDKELRPSLRGGHHSVKSRAKLLQKLSEQNGKQTDTTDYSTATALVADDSLEEEEEEKEVNSVEETFLTVPSGQKPDLVLATSPGTNFAESVLAICDIKRDLFGQKTYYSAFSDGSLVQTLRAKFVTEIYICGALTNISIFATAMDAARHGYAITIVGDCVGYRSKARHDEALRRLREFAGCEVISSTDLIESLQAKARMQRTPKRHARPPQRPKEKNAGLESLMASLSLKPEGMPPSTVSNSTGPSITVAESSNGGVAALAVDDTTESPEVDFPIRTTDTDGKKRERVKSKVKSRRRPSKSVPKDTSITGESGRPSLEKGTLTPTTATFVAASQALEKLPTPTLAEYDTSASVTTKTPTRIADSVESVYLVPDPELQKTENGVTPKNLEAPESTSDEKAGMEKLRAEGGRFSLCEGDTSIICNLLHDELEEGIFEKLRDEVRWQKMSHQGGDVPRLVVVQGEIGEDGSIPIYRHPADESPPLLPFSPTVSLIRAELEKKLGHPVNHVLIQFYRDGTDYISEHSDKTLDIVPNTFISNVSLGAQRTMVFRTKKPRNTDETVISVPAQPREAVRAPLPHNSMCKMGLVTNMRWLHSIRQDKRPMNEKIPEELAYGGGRISLTFRMIGTFLDKDQEKIWGQGAVANTKEEAHNVINGKTPEAEKMVWAFGTENHSSEFDWEATYGVGFDVLHMSSSPKLFLSGDTVADLRVKLMLAEYGIAWAEGKVSPSFTRKSGNCGKDTPAVPETFPVKFIDSDLSKSTIVGDLAILHYLDAVYGQLANNKAKSQTELAKQYTRMYQSGDILMLWKAVPFSVKPFRRELEMWETLAKEASFIAGPTVSLADYALWPILAHIQTEWGNFKGYDHLIAYCCMMRKRDSTVKVLGPAKGDGNLL
jgi:nicotinamidase-related amidase/glutathione S-transferase